MNSLRSWNRVRLYSQFGLLAGIYLAASSAAATGAASTFDAVGRLTLNGVQTCSASLVAKDLVLTAAHCLFDKRNGAKTKAENIIFEAGLAGQQAKSRRTISEYTLHPRYHYNRRNAQVSFDVALLRLTAPISPLEIEPLGFSTDFGRGDPVDIFSYQWRRHDFQQRSRNCEIFARKTHNVLLTCVVDQGASGAPILEKTNEERPKILSVVSARGRVGKVRVSVGTILDRDFRKLIGPGLD